jgi:CheY-like chemotaxis protein
MMKKQRILIVDDERGFTDMLGLNLESTGRFEIRVENSPTKTIETALRFRPDLILLDVIMPYAEGPDVAAELKASAELKRIPVIFLTATVTKEEVDSQDGMIGGHFFVAKPSSVEYLLSTIDKVLNT